MFGFILRLIVIKATILPSTTDYEKDLVVKKFIIAFDDKNLLANWMESRNIRCLTAIELLENSTRKVRDILSVINNEEFSVIKSMIMETNMVLTRIGYPYFETINIINSLQRILTINDKINNTKSKMQTNLEEIFYREYDMIYCILKSTIINFGFDFNSTETSENYMEWFNNKLEKETKFKETMCVTKNYKSMLHIIRYANCVLDSVLPNEIDNPLIFKASFEGFGNSTKCKDDAKYLFIREKTSMGYSECMLPYLKKTHEKSNLNKTDLKKYINKSFLCDKTLTKELITLFHYYSEILGKDTTYEVTLKEDKKYHIKWSFLKKPSVEEIKKYWMDQEVTDLSKLKISGKIGPAGINNIEYSTSKSVDTEKQPIGTRLIVLSCGDLLGFELVDEFLEKYYMKYTRPLDCPYCKQSTSIVGSYDAIVYRLKQNTPCIIG